MSTLNNLLSPLNQWLDTLEKRERHIVIGGIVALIIMLFYLIIWEPITENYNTQLQKYNSQRQLHSWMKNASAEIRSLKSSGGNNASRFKNQSISSLAERSAVSTGIKSFIEKIDQNKKGVKVKLKAANFDLIIRWLNDLQTKYGIISRKVSLEKTDVSGAVNAQITLERSS